MFAHPSIIIYYKLIFFQQVKDVRDHLLENRMESFFLAETTKYLYLLFDPDNFIHNTGGHGTIINTPNGECIIDAGRYTRDHGTLINIPNG